MAHAVTIDPEVMHGQPVFRGTRVPVEDFPEEFPTVSRALEEAQP